MFTYFAIMFLAHPALAYPVLFQSSGTLVSFWSIAEHDEIFGSPLCFDLIISAFLVLAGGAFAGLTIGLMGLDELHLRVLATSSDDHREKTNAHQTLKLLEKGRHWVLVVLLLGNVIVNESLPIFLDNAIGGGITAIIISTTAIVIFGEVIPQALSVRYGLAIGAACAPIVQVMMWIFSPVAWPFAKLLDFLLGAHTTHTYKRKELKSLLHFHRNGPEPLHDEEINMLDGVLDLNSKPVTALMTPIQDFCTLSTDAVLDDVLVCKLLSSGFTRFPVHEPGNPLIFIGFLSMEKLVAYNTSDAMIVGEFPLYALPEVPPSISCFQALEHFRTRHSQLLLVTRTPDRRGGAIGIVSLDDVVEDILMKPSKNQASSVTSFSSNRTRRNSRPLRTTCSAANKIIHRNESERPFETISYERIREHEEPSDGERSTLIGTPPLNSSVPSPLHYGAVKQGHLQRKWTC